MNLKDKFTGIVLLLVSVLITIMVIWAASFYWIPRFQDNAFTRQLQIVTDKDSVADNTAKLKKELAQVRNMYNRLSPGNVYMVINTTENSFRVYKTKAVDYEGICSTGSYIHLEAEGNKEYRFETPKGVFTIRNKITDPVWRKPDWAFVEEGLPIPPPTHSSRYEYGVLGDYALDIGNGYLIHGTLYQRFLGLPVTHGCVRLNDKDLDYVYHELSIGSKVFIY